MNDECFDVSFNERADLLTRYNFHCSDELKRLLCELFKDKSRTKRIRTNDVPR
jgi:hypothetical protein